MPRLERRGHAVVALGGQQGEVDPDALGAGAQQQVDRHVGGTAVHHRRGAGAATAPSTSSSAGAAPWASTERCRQKPDAVGTAPASTAGSAGSSTCTSRSAPGTRRRTSAMWDAEPLGQRLSKLAAGAVVGQDAVAAWPLDGCREGPRAGHLDLERPGVALGLLLEGVEVLARASETARRWSTPPPAPVSRQPGGLQVGTELGHDGERAADHVRVRHRARAARACAAATARRGRRWTRLVVVARRRPRASSPTPEARVMTGLVDAIVHEPTTRVPS